MSHLVWKVIRTLFGRFTELNHVLRFWFQRRWYEKFLLHEVVPISAENGFFFLLTFWAFRKWTFEY